MMGWTAGVVGAGGVLVLGCAIGMGLLIWLLFRLTGSTGAPVSVQVPRQARDPMVCDGVSSPHPGLKQRTPSGPAGSGSVVA